MYASPRRVKSPRSKAPSTDHTNSKIPSAEYSSTPRDAVAASQHMQRERNISSSTRAASINKEIPNYIGIGPTSEYTPKIPSMCRPRPQQQLSPEKVPPGSRTQYPSPTRPSSFRKAESSNSSLNPPIAQDFNLSTSIDPLESLRRPATSSSPYRSRPLLLLNLSLQHSLPKSLRNPEHQMTDDLFQTPFSSLFATFTIASAIGI